MNAVKSRRLAQEVHDTYRRAVIGGPFYLVAWMIVGAYGNAFARTPTLSWSLAAAFLLLALFRLAQRPPSDGNWVANLAWLRICWGIVVVTATLWGGVFYWAVSDPSFGPARTAAILTTIGLATAFAHTFSMRRSFALMGIIVLYLPGLMVVWTDPAERATALVMSVYGIYVVVSLLRSHADYHLRLDVDQDLRDQRDLFARQSRIDSLTELANRRHFAETLGLALRHAQATGEPLSLLLLDIDHFKQINDSHGHAVGDACLAELSARLRSQFSGSGELVARLGGEEFGAVLPGESCAQTTQRAEEFRRSLAGQPMVFDGVALSVTVSIGLAEFDPAGHRDVDGLYRAADRAVYRAKDAGRNQVCRDEAIPA